METMSAPSWTLCRIWRLKMGIVGFWIERDWSQKSYYSNNNKGVICCCQLRLNDGQGTLLGKARKNDTIIKERKLLIA